MSHKIRDLNQALIHIKNGTSIYHGFKAILKFSWLPVTLDNGSTSWWEDYVLIIVHWGGHKSSGDTIYRLTPEEYGNLPLLGKPIYAPGKILPFNPKR